MVRRKSAFVLVLLLLLILFVSHWASAPAPETVPAATPQAGEKPSPQLTAAQEKPADLRVEAVADDQGFDLLQKQNAVFRQRHPDINVELVQRSYSEAYSSLDVNAAAEANPPDVMLVPSEWVQRMAVQGDLLPVDGAYVGDALSEQFDALVAPLKWNGYLWGVPRSFDPYVLVWNKNVLGAIHRNNAPAFSPPLSWEDWKSLPGALISSGISASWLAIDDADPYALLAWLGAVTGHRSDALFDSHAAEWSGQPFEEALTLLLQARQGVRTGPRDADFWAAFAAGRTAVAVVRNSEAEQALNRLPDSAAASLMIDRSSWDEPYVWANGDSFVMSSLTPHEEAARAWIEEMTGEQNQRQNFSELGRLPVFRSLYISGDGTPDLSIASPHSFPNEQPFALGPAVPPEVRRLAGLWKLWMQGGLTLDDWKKQWPGLQADFEPNN